MKKASISESEPLNAPAPAVADFDTERNDSLDSPSTRTNGEKRTFRGWLRTIWPLALHGLYALLISSFMIFYVHNNHFNLVERRPSVALTDGSMVRSSRFTPLQSDISTLISIFLSTIRWVLTTWAGVLSWHGLFYLLEEPGLTHHDVRQMISNYCLSRSAYIRNRHTCFIGIILLVTTCTQFSAPILTGSITWVPANQPAAELPLSALVSISVASDSEEWYGYLTNQNWRERLSLKAGGYAAMAWGRGIETGISKRIIPSASALAINSTVANVTLPYFSVTSFEWIKNPGQTLTAEQLNVTDRIVPMLSTRAGRDSLTVPGTFAFIPEENWTTEWEYKPLPPPSMVSETRILVAYTSRSSECRSDGLDISIPSNIDLYLEKGTYCYSFARLSYRAGAGICIGCRLSANSTVQSDGPLAPVKDSMTGAALRMLPDVINNLALMNSSIPYTGDFEGYVKEVLARAYSGAWSALTERTGRSSPKLTSRFSSTLPALRAQVSPERVYIWLSLQLLVTFFGVFFLALQFKCHYPLTGNTSLVPLYLDSTGIAQPDEFGRLRAEEWLTVSRRGRQLKLLGIPNRKSH